MRIKPGPLPAAEQAEAQARAHAAGAAPALLRGGLQREAWGAQVYFPWSGRSGQQWGACGRRGHGTAARRRVAQVMILKHFMSHQWGATKEGLMEWLLITHEGAWLLLSHGLGLG